ncbi:MAG: hypothetical protein M1824_005640 [Vezdaea acicularis]|nr:MAG: hypothetical protein M1824_005640 [Vezdaea acicularis]
MYPSTQICIALLAFVPHFASATPVQYLTTSVPTAIATPAQGFLTSLSPSSTPGISELISPGSELSELASPPEELSYLEGGGNDRVRVRSPSGVNGPPLSGDGEDDWYLYYDLSAFPENGTDASQISGRDADFVERPAEDKLDARSPSAVDGPALSSNEEEDLPRPSPIYTTLKSNSSGQKTTPIFAPLPT